MPKPSDPYPTTKTKRKVYASVRAVITFSTKNRSDAEQLSSNFLSRKGITQHEDAVYSSDRKRTTVTLVVDYRVHGGWRSDFVRKVEADASDLGIDVEDLSVEAERTEIPHECPRRECIPCSIAIDPSALYSFSRDKKTEPTDETLDNVEPEEDKSTRWNPFRR